MKHFPKLMMSPLLLVGGMAVAADHPCARVERADARLECYDKAFPPEVAAPSTVLVPRDEVQMREDFGLGEGELQRRRPLQAAEPEVDRITGVVSRIEDAGRGQRLVRLENGQMWRLTEGSSRGPLQPGDQVEIRRGAFSAYQLVTPGGVGLRARRVQ